VGVVGLGDEDRGLELLDFLVDPKAFFRELAGVSSSRQASPTMSTFG